MLTTDFLYEAFEPEMDWSRWGVKIAQRDIPKLADKLEAIGPGEIKNLQVRWFALGPKWRGWGSGGVDGEGRTGWGVKIAQLPLGLLTSFTSSHTRTQHSHRMPAQTHPTPPPLNPTPPHHSPAPRRACGARRSTSTGARTWGASCRCGLGGFNPETLNPKLESSTGARTWGLGGIMQVCARVRGAVSAGLLLPRHPVWLRALLPLLRVHSTTPQPLPNRRPAQETGEFDAFSSIMAILRMRKKHPEVTFPHLSAPLDACTHASRQAWGVEEGLRGGPPRRRTSTSECARTAPYYSSQRRSKHLSYPTLKTHPQKPPALPTVPYHTQAKPEDFYDMDEEYRDFVDCKPCGYSCRPSAVLPGGWCGRPAGCLEARCRAGCAKPRLMLIVCSWLVETVGGWRSRR